MLLLQNILLAAALASTAFARCYPKAEKKEEWKDKKDALNAAKFVCREFRGEYKPNQQKTKCVNGPNGQRYEFYSLMDQNPDNRRSYDLEEGQCVDRFAANVDCERGGQTTNKYITFTSMPNKGKC